MICWVKSFGILYLLLRIGDPAADLRASQKTAAGQDKFTTGALIGRGIANVKGRTRSPAGLAIANRHGS
jgi:hypothetical protein